jgi:hypothetical protein
MFATEFGQNRVDEANRGNYHRQAV